jgi:hypothetical protein
LFSFAITLIIVGIFNDDASGTVTECCWTSCLERGKVTADRIGLNKPYATFGVGVFDQNRFKRSVENFAEHVGPAQPEIVSDSVDPEVSLLAADSKGVWGRLKNDLSFVHSLSAKSGDCEITS